MSLPGFVQWTLRYRIAEGATHAARPRPIQVQGVPANALVELRVMDGCAEAFDLESKHDRVGRRCAAGEMMVAMFGVDRQGRHRLPATEFTRSVAASQAEVHLCIRTADVPDVDRIAVSVDGDLCPAQNVQDF